MPSVTAKRRRSSRTLRIIALVYVAILVVLPVGVVIQRTIKQGGQAFWDSISSPDAVHAFQVTGIVVGCSVALNTLFGVGVALLLARYRFVGRRILDLLIDVPISISPIVVGLALVLAYGATKGWFGGGLADIGIQVIFATPGMVLATTFVSLPLVLREVLPVLEEEGMEQEYAARSLGASTGQRLWRITLPTIRWALAYGVVLSVARSLGEFGALRVVSGDVSGKTQTLTLLVDQHAEQFEPGAYQLSIVLIAVSVLCIVGVSFVRPKGE